MCLLQHVSVHAKTRSKGGCDPLTSGMQATARFLSSRAYSGLLA